MPRLRKPNKAHKQRQHLPNVPKSGKYPLEVHFKFVQPDLMVCPGSWLLQVGQNPTGEAAANKGQERAIKRLEAAVRELARMQMAQGERDSVMLGTKSREQNGEVFKCLSCDNNPVPLNDVMQRSSVDVLPLLPSAAPQVRMIRHSTVTITSCQCAMYPM